MKNRIHCNATSTGAVHVCELVTVAVRHHNSGTGGKGCVFPSPITFSPEL